MNPASDHSRPWPDSIRLIGTVAGAPAGGRVSGRRRLWIGSGRRCDWVLPDPLVPRRACRLTRRRLRRAGPFASSTGTEAWVLDVRGGARVLCNGEHVRRVRLRPGDRLTVGCHQIEILKDDGRPFPDPSRLDVAARCHDLTAVRPAPVSFLSRSSDYQGRRRLRAAWLAGVAAVGILMLLVWMFPPDPVFLNIQPPMQVVMVGEVSRAPSPRAVRRLDQVERREWKSPETRIEEADLANAPIPEPGQPEAAFMPTDPLNAATAPERISAPAPVVRSDLPPLTEAVTRRRQMEMTRTPSDLKPPSPPRRRLTLRESADPVFRAEPLDAPDSEPSLPRPTPAAWRAVRAAPGVERQPAPAPVTAPPDASDHPQLLLAQQASPLTFENHQGTRIPIARLPDASLALMEVRSEEAGVEFDGMVSDAEMAMSWKSGRFRIHGPNPRQADPPTYCYVGRRQEQGQDFLYVSFVCEDPDVGALRSGHPEGLWRDDSVELFLDTDANRRDYYHMIINCRGRYTATYCANGDIGINGQGTPWNAQPRIRTGINAAARRWSAEILIPFHALGGTPAKGSRWVVNFTRAFRGQGLPGSVYQNWFLVYNGRETNYHNPELFGVLEW